VRRLAWLLTACAAPQAPAPPIAAPVARPHIAAPRNQIAVRWSNISTVAGCFYFRGPVAGRDAQLGTEATLDQDGPLVRLGFPTATFAGVAQEGEVHLVLRSEHAHEGAWTVTERIHGTLDGGVLRGRYHYEECLAGAPCPGRCVMHADLVTRWRAR
jgi:hypothetical protein